MAYEDLRDDEAIAFHWAVINKHQAMLADLYAKQSALTDAEKSERSKRIAVSISENVLADSFKVEAVVVEEATPSEKETLVILEGDK